VDHHGNNWVDGYLPQGFVFLWERPSDLSRALDIIVRDHHVDWVGAGGFSAGGYTAAALLGARLDSDLLQAVVDGRILVPDPPEFPGAVDWLRRTVMPQTTAATMQRASGDMSDDRIEAAFLVCPGDSGLTTTHSLRSIAHPVEILWAGTDVIAPPEETALRFLDLIGTAHGLSLGAHVERHHLFPDNPDGGNVRRQAAADAVAFFTKVSGLTALGEAL
jgi:predicted dienelactone hydrolase